MAAVAEMGEVDEMISKEEGGIITNGDISNDIDMENDSQDSLKKATLPESMEVDELEEEAVRGDKLESTSLTEESNDCNEENENTAEDDDEEASSVASENPSENHSAAQDDSQETKKSGDQTEEQGESSESEEIKVIDPMTEKEVATNEKEEATNEDEDDEEANDNKEAKGDEEANDNDDKTKNDENSRHSTEVSEKIEEISEKTPENQEDVVHEIHSDDDEVEENKICNEPIELNDSDGDGNGDVMFVDEPKQNGTSEVINIDESPKKKEQIKTEDLEDIAPPRRSSRNLNKSKSYVESDKESEKEESPHLSEESDVEEVLPQDPLACSDAVTVEKIPPAVPKPPPGRGPVPVNSKPSPIPLNTSSFQTVLPMALPAQGMYPPNMRATITPIPLNSTNIASTPPVKSTPATITPAVTTPLLPTLTDDMFVVEAPSFIVPYVYEKPPVKDFKSFIEDIQKEIKAKLKSLEIAEKALLKKELQDGEVKKEDEDDENKSEKDSDEEEVKPEDKHDPVYVPKKELEDPKKPYSYFDSPLGKFFINIGFGLVQEFVQTDLLKQQKRKHSREGGANPETERTIRSLVKNLETCKPQNEHFKLELKKCEFCNFKTESALAMSYHLETPHMKNFVYKCNFCAYEVRSPHDILFHMEAEHAVRGHLERAPAFHQCPNCPFEDNGKGKLSRHLVTCMRKFKPERNLEPPVDWEPPAKIPRVPKIRQQGLNATAAAYQAMSKSSQYQFLSKMQLQGSPNVVSRGRGRPSLGGNLGVKSQPMIRPQGLMLKQQNMSGGSVMVPTNYQLNQVFQVVGGQELSGRLGNPSHVFLPNMSSASSTMAFQSFQNQSKKAGQQQPSISITPLPRGPSATVSPAAAASPAKPGDTTSKNSFVICEICDGYIKDLEQLRNHMQWIHKIKIHPKMIYNRPPLNCQKCQFRFFTDQGLERHLLGSHGLVTSSMQDAANKSKDSGRCPVCGRVYQWKLLNHVARDHNMTLKPAHLSYKCTVCTATFGMYKQFENHVYSAHSVVAKRVMDKKTAPTSAAATSVTAVKSEQLKPLKINDEITIIPQPAKSTNGKDGAAGNSKSSTPGTSKNAEMVSVSASRGERVAQKNVDVK